MPFGRFAVFSRNSTFYNKTQKLGICDEMRAHKLSEIESGLKSFLETEIERQLSDYEEQRAEIVAIENQCIELRKRLGEETHVLVEKPNPLWKDLKALKEAFSSELRLLQEREMQLAKLIADNVAQGRRLAEDLGESGCLSAVSEKAEISKEFLRGVLKFNKSLRAVQEQKTHEITRLTQNLHKLKTSLGLPTTATTTAKTQTIPPSKTAAFKTADRISLLNSELDALVALYASRRSALQALHSDAQALLRRATALDIQLAAEPPTPGLGDLSPARLAHCDAAVLAMADELYASAAIKADSSRAAIEVLYRELDVCLNKRLSADFLSFNLKNRLSDNSFSLHQNGLDDSIVTEANDKAKALGQPITPELMANLRCEEKRLLTLKKVRESVDFLMARRERILSERATLNDTDPERFRIPGRLLREEKTRAMVAELPAVATRLRKLSLLIEAGTGRPVLFDGERLDELLDRFEKDEAERKERDRAALERRRVGRVSGGVGNVRREEVFKTPTKKFGGRVPQSLVCGKSRKRVDGEEKNGEEGASVAQRAKTPDGKRRVRAVFSVPISLK